MFRKVEFSEEQFFLFLLPSFGPHPADGLFLQIPFESFLLELEVGFVVAFLFSVVFDVVVETFSVIAAEAAAFGLMAWLEGRFFLSVVMRVLGGEGEDGVLNLLMVLLEVVFEL